MSGVVVGVIPARKGSRRLPGKNLLKIEESSLIALAIRSATSSGVIDHLVVNSDDPAVLAEAQDLGVKHLQARPHHLATEATPTAAVIGHALEELASTSGIVGDIIITLQPTSPLRRAHEVREAFRAWQKDPSRPLTTCAAPLQPVKDFVARHANGNLVPLVPNVGQVDDKSIRFLDGMIYVTPRNYLFERNKLFDLTDGELFEIDPLRAVDIDYGFQFDLAQRLH